MMHRSKADWQMRFLSKARESSDGWGAFGSTWAIDVEDREPYKGMSKNDAVGPRLFVNTSLGWQQTGSHGRGLNLVLGGQWTMLPLSLHRGSEGRNMALRTVDTEDVGSLEESRIR